MVKKNEKCPCGSGLEYTSCCRLFHEGEKSASSALELMKSRYAAYAYGKIDYIRNTTAPSFRKYYDFMQLEHWANSVIWMKLEIVFYKKKEVCFKAYYADKGSVNCHHEHSFFSLQKGKWYYTEGEILED